MKHSFRTIGLSVFVAISLFSSAVFASGLGDYLEAQKSSHDVPGHWAGDYIGYFIDQGFVKGGSFNPDDAVNRAEFLKMLILATGVDTNYDGEWIFEDVQSGDWYADYVMTAYEEGLINGYGDGKFHPENLITRAEALKMLLMAQDIPVGDFNTTYYSDVSGWSLPYIETQRVLGLNLIRPFGEIFQPDVYLSRAESVHAIFRGVVALNAYFDSDYEDFESDGTYRFVRMVSTNYQLFSDEEPGIRLDWISASGLDETLVSAFSFSKHLMGEQNLMEVLSSSDDDYTSLGESGTVTLDLGRDFFGETYEDNIILLYRTMGINGENIYAYGDHVKYQVAETPFGPWYNIHETDFTMEEPYSGSLDFRRDFYTEDRLYLIYN